MKKLLAICVFGFSIGPAFSASSCEADFKKYCSDVNEADCIKKNKHQFSSSCQSELKTLKSKSGGIISNCMGDIQKHCPINVDRFQKEGIAYMDEYKKCVAKAKEKFSGVCKEQLKGLGGSSKKGPRVLR